MYCSSAFFLGLLLPMVLSSHPEIKTLTGIHNGTVNGLDQLQTVYKMVSNVAGSIDEQGNCVCVIYLPNSLIPLQQIEKLQNTAEELVKKYELELSKVDEHTEAIRAQEKTMLELIQHLEWRQQDSESESESGHTSHPSIDHHWEALQWELLEAERLLTQLKAQARVMGDNGSSNDSTLQRVHGQVQNASIILQYLVNSQQDNLQTILHKLSTLESQLSDCKKKNPGLQTQNLPSGSCAHGTLLSVSRPLVVQLNWRGFHYKAGAWGRDTGLNLISSLYWVAHFVLMAGILTTTVYTSLMMT
ncbi:olfactomedin-4-like [Sminthopsis crassicaudata]|uniref:olfactomedin-4-like n=1 Tax=Sminthopsis crassicaudata TaxID=9301 RepID=UPI003D680C81